jgi:uncharacterized protein YndB with AHSA1/START domain
MAEIDVTTDESTLSMTLTARFAAPVEKVWRVWADPDLLGRWWGPPTYPATVVRHELKPGGVVHYFMTSPEGHQHYGLFQMEEVDEPRLLRFQDAFADAEGNAQPQPPGSRIQVTLEPDGEATRMTTVTVFPSAEAMAQLLAMGMREGMMASTGQIDDVLASIPA